MIISNIWKISFHTTVLYARDLLNDGDAAEHAFFVQGWAQARVATIIVRSMHAFSHHLNVDCSDITGEIIYVHEVCLFKRASNVAVR